MCVSMHDYVCVCVFQMPELVVYSDPYTLGELKLTVVGGAILGGQTVQPLQTRQNGFNSKCSFHRLTIGPPGQYVLEVRSTSDPEVVLRSDTFTVTPPPMRQSQLGQVFDDFDKMLQF